MDLINDDKYNSLHWQDITPEELKILLRGSTILDFEAIDFPLIDGVDLYIKDKSKSVWVISIQADIDNYIHINDVVRSHKDTRQHLQYKEMQPEPEAEEANPIKIIIAKVGG